MNHRARGARLALIALAVGSCGRGPSDGPVLLVSVDTLSADRVGAWGCPFARTPELDRLDRKSVV